MKWSRFLLCSRIWRTNFSILFDFSQSSFYTLFGAPRHPACNSPTLASADYLLLIASIHFFALNCQIRWYLLVFLSAFVSRSLAVDHSQNKSPRSIGNPIVASKSIKSKKIEKNTFFSKVSLFFIFVCSFSNNYLHSSF